jgi:hypothetical protein
LPATKTGGVGTGALSKTAANKRVPGIIFL